MPRYDYKCPDGHTTERIVPLAKAPGPKKIKCKEPVKCEPYCIAGEGIFEEEPCGKPAKRIEVYTPGVSGTPTRGAF